MEGCSMSFSMSFHDRTFIFVCEVYFVFRLEFGPIGVHHKEKPFIHWEKDLCIFMEHVKLVQRWDFPWLRCFHVLAGIPPSREP